MCGNIWGFVFYESLSLCSLEMWHHHFAAPKSDLSILWTLKTKTLTPEYWKGWSSARSSLNICLSPWAGCQVGKPSLISHLEQEEELRTEDRELHRGPCPGKRQADTSAAENLHLRAIGMSGVSLGNLTQVENALSLSLHLHPLKSLGFGVPSSLNLRWPCGLFVPFFLLNIPGHTLNSIINVSIWRVNS